MASSMDASPCGVGEMDAVAALGFFDERVRWQVSQFQGALENVECVTAALSLALRKACGTDRGRNALTRALSPFAAACAESLLVYLFTQSATTSYRSS